VDVMLDVMLVVILVVTVAIETKIEIDHRFENAKKIEAPPTVERETDAGMTTVITVADVKIKP
jgi:biopolymer transport protein ExbD